MRLINGCTRDPHLHRSDVIWTHNRTREEFDDVGFRCPILVDKSRCLFGRLRLSQFGLELRWKISQVERQCTGWKDGDASGQYTWACEFAALYASPQRYGVLSVRAC